MPLARFTPAILLNVNRFDEDETKLTSVQIVDPLDSANVAVSGPGLVGPVLKNWIEDKVALVPELGPANELLSELLRNYTVIPFGD